MATDVLLVREGTKLGAADPISEAAAASADVGLGSLPVADSAPLFSDLSSSSVMIPRLAASQRLQQMIQALANDCIHNPEIQAKIDRWVAETGRGPDELIEDAVAGYFEELAQTRELLNSRYDDLKSGRVKPIPGDQVIARLRKKSADRRSQPGVRSDK